MTTGKERPRVLLIYGNSGHGKSHLAKQLKDNCGYHLVKLDDLYFEFIKDRYPDLYLNDLMLVIGQHHDYILPAWDRPGEKYDGAQTSWRDFVASRAEDASRQHSLVAIEGYLLGPILETVRQKLDDKATVTTVEVMGRQYFVNGVVKSLEQICGRNDSADDQS